MQVHFVEPKLTGEAEQAAAQVLEQGVVDVGAHEIRPHALERGRVRRRPTTNAVAPDEGDGEQGGEEDRFFSHGGQSFDCYTDPGGAFPARIPE